LAVASLVPLGPRQSPSPQSGGLFLTYGALCFTVPVPDC
jgi:hypothetical protein